MEYELLGKPMDELWEMNIHHNPIDEESRETIKQHKSILMNDGDDFVAYIKHSENARKQKVHSKVFQEKLRDFAKTESIYCSTKTKDAN